MSIQRIDQLRATTVQQQQEVADNRQRLTLFNVNTFERTPAVTTGGGKRIDVPSMSDADRVTAGQLFAMVPPEKRETVQQAADAFAEALRNEVATNPQGVQTATYSAGLTQALGNCVVTFASTSGAPADQAVQTAIFMGIVPLERDLRDFATNLRAKTDAANELRTDIAELREQLADWPEGQSQEVTWTEVTINSDGTVHTEVRTAIMTKEEAEDLLQSLDDGLTGLREMTELDRIDLQNMNQDYHQVLNTLTGILKAQHDVLKALINNLKA